MTDMIKDLDTWVRRARVAGCRSLSQFTIAKYSFPNFH